LLGRQLPELRGSSRGSAKVRYKRRAEQPSEVAGPFANPLRGGDGGLIMVAIFLWIGVVAVFVFVVAFMFSA